MGFRHIKGVYTADDEKLAAIKQDSLVQNTEIEEQIILIDESGEIISQGTEKEVFVEPLAISNEKTEEVVIKNALKIIEENSIVSEEPKDKKQTQKTKKSTSKKPTATKTKQKKVVPKKE